MMFELFTHKTEELAGNSSASELTLEIGAYFFGCAPGYAAGLLTT